MIKAEADQKIRLGKKIEFAVFVKILKSHLNTSRGEQSFSDKCLGDFLVVSVL